MGMGGSRVRHLEDALQKDCVDWAARALPDDAVLFAIPNGGKRTPREGQRFKETGVIAGIPDLCLICRGRPVFIELKAGKNKPTKIQRDMHLRLTVAGAVVFVVRTLDEFRYCLDAVCGKDLKLKVKT